ncbi:TKL protein kinase [Fonticula alba]|uniref:TKL protein kinase n=1 Tax=Fonticula alba TaxID=691883 RepID=A0A058Z2H1_FONAL|nr:TKL protein kinase [Fonticula alba]KCV68128.1 TKL protein kinase [Fonticula alba]|eukprot:XP_009497502.1 TKL protein kinase [Fonticula alba]
MPWLVRRPAGPRPPSPARPVLALALALTLLLLLLPAHGSAPAGLFLLEAPRLLGKSPSGGQALLLPGEPMVHHSAPGDQVNIFKQGINLDLFSDARLGSVFFPDPDLILRFAGVPDSLTSEPMLVPMPGELPSLVWLSGSRVGVSTEDLVHTFDLPAGGPARLLAAVSRSASDTSILLGLGTGKTLVLRCYASAWSLIEIPTGANGGTAGLPGHLYVAASMSGWVWAPEGGPMRGFPVDDEPVLRVAATRFITDDPDSLDLVIVTDQRLRVLVGLKDNHQPARVLDAPLSAEQRDLSTELVPELAPGASPSGFLYLLSNGTTLWRVSALPDNALAWQRVSTPSGFFAAPSRVSLMSMDLGAAPAGPAERWVLVRDGRAFFTNEQFGCGVDASIVCDAAAHAWRCAPGRRLSPLRAAGELCAGCSDGFYPVPVGAERRICQPCPTAGCRSCGDDGVCRACDTGLLLLRDTATHGPGACVPSCPAGSLGLGEECVPDALPGARLHLHPLTLVQGARITSVGMTRAFLKDGQVFVSNASLRASRPGSVAIIINNERLAFLDTEQLATAPGQALTFRQPSRFPMLPEVEQILEMGPFITRLNVRLEYLLTGSMISRLELTCTLAGVGPDDGCPLEAIWIALPDGLWPGVEPAQRLSPSLVAYDHVLGSYEADGTMVQVVEPATMMSQRPVVAMHRDPVTGRPVEWLYRPGPAPHLAANPLALVKRLDPRCRYADSVHGAGVAAGGGGGGGGGGGAAGPVAPGTSWKSVALETGASASGAPRSQDIVTMGFDQIQDTYYWLAKHYAGGVDAQSRTRDIVGTGRVLHPLAGVTSRPDFLLLGLDLEGSPRPEYPSALAFVTSSHVGVALLHCPAHGAACALGPSHVLSLGSEGSFAWASRLSMAQVPGPERLPDGRPALGALLVVVRDTTSASRSFLVQVAPGECPPGTYGPECRPCHPACQACNGPDSLQCSSPRCDFFLAGRPDACLAGCPAGLQPASTGACVCHAGCVSCHGPTAGGPFVCAGCQPGMALDPGTRTRCLPCHASCAECGAPDDPGACWSCPPDAGTLLRPDGSCGPGCPAGAWPDVGARVCRPCPAGCAECLVPGACDACRPGFLLSASLRLCLPCEPQCATCAGGLDACLACAPGMHWADGAPPGGPGPGPTGACDVCPRVCATCDAEGRCLSCQPGRLLVPATGACLAECPVATAPDASGQVCGRCHASCSACLAPGDPAACSACPAPHVLHVSGECLDACPGGFRPEAGHCVPCSAGCALCTLAGACDLCDPGRYHAGGDVCAPCPSSCAACADGAACTACRPGLVFLDPEPGVPSLCGSTCAPGEYVGAARCAACDGSCELCAGGPNRCQVCAAGFRWGTAPGPGGTGTCVACEPGCASCTSTACLSCAPGFLLTAAGACVGACPAGSFSNGESCQPCDISCAACAGGMGNQCTDCAAGLELVEVTPGVGTCVSGCPEGQYRAGVECLPCDAACATCNGPTDKDCWRCASGVLQGGDCHCLSCAPGTPLMLDTSCVAACPGTHFAAGGALCLPCSPYCGRCSGPGRDQCTACPADRVLVPAGECLGACPAGQYARQQPGHDGPVCQPCSASCWQCSGPGPGQCTACMGDMLLQDGQCVAACAGGSFACGPAGRCLPCPAGCATCRHLASRPDGCVAQCTSCQGALLLSPVGGTCGEACPPGEFLPRGEAAQGGVCQPCAPACAGCHERADRCTKCAGPGHWLRSDTGACVEACPPAGLAMSPVEQVCLACGQDCERCAAGPATPGCTLAPDGRLECPTPAACHACVAGLFLLNGASCVADCPAGTFADRAALAPGCAACHPDCPAGTCTGPERVDCSGSAGGSPGRRGLALGLGLGLGLLLLLLLGLAIFLMLRLRRGPKPPAGGEPDENSTVLNTIVEISLPGAILVDVLLDFQPLDGPALGAGAQASVFAARPIGTGLAARLGCPDTVAIKQMRVDAAEPWQLAAFQNEIALMWLLREHPAIVRLYGYSDQPPAIIMHRYQTDLATLLHSDVPLDQATILDIAQQWASGLEAMHAHGIAHRDLKPANVFASLLDSGAWSVALGDLGTSQNLSTDRSSALVATAPELNAMTARYAAPEVLVAFQLHRPLDRELLLPADIYSAAVMLWECLAREVPWKVWQACVAVMRPAHRAAAFPTLGLVLLALVLALLHSGATSSEIIHYQIAPGGDLCPGLSNPSGAALHRFDPGRPTQLARAYPGQSVICTLEQQTPPATGNGRDFRTGARFLDHDQDQNLGLLSTCRETSSLATDELIAFQGVTPSPEGPCHVGFGNNRMAILSPSGSIYVWSGTSLRVFFPGGSPSLAFKDITPVQASILDVAVLPLDAQSPDGLVLLLSNGQVRIYPKATADALGGSASFQLTLPSGMGPDFCLIAPMRSEFPQASQTRPPWIHVVHTVEGQLFQLSLDFTHPQAVALSEVALPPNAEQATSLRPFQLLDSQGQAIWGLANRKLYLPSSIFSLNNSDQSIRCDDATSEAKHDDGYTCQDSRERALFARDQALCSACALGRRFTDSRHACSACPDHCDVCSDTTCLVCESGLHLVVHPSTGDTTCEEECANIDLAVDDLPPDGRCLPAVPDSSPETGDDPLFPTLATTSMGLQFPNGLSVVFRSRLFPDNNQCHLRRDTSTPGDLLGITQQSNLLISIVPGPNGPTSLTTTQLPCLPILQFTIIDAVELGIAGGPALVLMCMANGSTLSMRFACSGTSAGASVCPVATPVPFNLSISNCRSLRRLAADLATVLTDDGTVYFLSLPGPNSSLEVRPAAGLPGMHGHPTWLPGVPESNTPGHTPWLLFGQDDQAPHPAGTLAGHAHPLDLLLAGDSRLQVGMGQRALARPADTLANFEALTLGPAPGEVFLSGLRLADGQVVWQAAHLPAGSHWHGRSTGIPSNLEALGTLPGSSTSVPSHRVLPVDLPAPAEPPSLGYRVPGLLVLRTAGHVGLSALLCHPSTGACWLQAARFLPAPESLLDGLSVAVFAAHASGIAGAGMLATPPDPGILVVHVLLASPDEQSQPVMLSMALDLCLEGTHGPACAACHPACASCTGPGLGDCTSCTFRLAGTANDGQSCLASCTGASVTGFHRGTCACHDDCDGCEVQHLGPSTDPLPTVVCTACHGAKVPSVPPAIGASGCLDCHTTCAKCSVPGEALACTECFPGQGLLHQNECRATCPPGFRPDAASAACIACQPRCLACGQDDTCTDCVAGYFPQGPACQPCASSCAACADGAACTACQPGLVFLDPDPGVPSLCGSTCAPGEYVGAGRCAACDGSCELCAGGPDQCRVCAEGFRWAGPAPGPGGTGTCVACEPGCASCTGTACLSCAPGLLLTAAGACVSACPAGSFSNGESCQPCDISCAACAGGMGNQCTDCLGFDEIRACVAAGTRPGDGQPAPGPAAMADLLTMAWDPAPGSRPLAASFRQAVASAAVFSAAARR